MPFRLGWLLGPMAILGCVATGSATVQVQTSAARPDSARIHRQALGAQKRFERQRRNLLPWKDPSGNEQPCIEVLAARLTLDGQVRWCVVPGNDRDSSWKPVPTPPEIGVLRREMLVELDSLARLLPGDAWIAGQRVFYLAEDEQWNAALEAAAECQPHAHWFCLGLKGFAAHAGGAEPQAEAWFAASLAAMPDQQRCAWTDVSHLLEGRVRKIYERLPCEARDSLERRFWWLADPLYAVPGNDRRSEHLARHLRAGLQEPSEQTDRFHWGSDLTRVLVRWGWPAEFRRVRTYATLAAEPLSPGIDVRWHGWPFDPDETLLLRPERADTSHWEDGRAFYAPPYARSFAGLRHQIARFYRGDSVRVVAGYDMADDSVPAGASVVAGLVLAPSENVAPQMHVDSTATPQGTLTVTAPVGSTLLSLEALARAAKRAARYRAWLPLERVQAPAISDLLLLRDSAATPKTLEQAVDFVRPSNHVRPGESIAIWWELYGVPSRQVAFGVTLVRPDKSWFREGLEALGLARSNASISLAWDEETPADSGPLGRGLGLRLPLLPPGRYALQVTARVSGQHLVATRELVVDSETTRHD